MNASVKSADRVLDILELFASTDRALALRDVARILGFPKSSAHMLLGTLTARGYLVRATDDLYRLAPAMDQGGWVGGIAGQIFRAAQPVLDRLVREQEESIVLGAPTARLDVRLLSHRVSPQVVRYDVTTMPVIPGWCTAMGHAILSRLPEDRVRAYLDETDRSAETPQTVTDIDAIIDKLAQHRARGHSLNIDERFEGASGAAVAICDPAGHPHAALNCVTVTPRFLRKQSTLVAALKSAAAQIEAEVFGKAALTTELRA